MSDRMTTDPGLALSAAEHLKVRLLGREPVSAEEHRRAAEALLIPPRHRAQMQSDRSGSLPSGRGELEYALEVSAGPARSNLTMQSGERAVMRRELSERANTSVAELAAPPEMREFAARLMSQMPPEEAKDVMGKYPSPGIVLHPSSCVRSLDGTRRRTRAPRSRSLKSPRRSPDTSPNSTPRTKRIKPPSCSPSLGSHVLQDFS
jgi:hypothetical protein